jgi:hypothetical protein
MVIYVMFTNNRFYPVSSISEQYSQASVPGGLPQFHSFQSCFGSLYVGYEEADHLVGLWQERNLECEVTGVILTHKHIPHFASTSAKFVWGVGVLWTLLPRIVQNTSSESKLTPLEWYPKRISTEALARAIVVFVDRCRKMQR